MTKSADDGEIRESSEGPSELSSGYAPSIGDRPAPRKAKKSRKGGIPRGRDPKRRRSQNVQSQKKYRDKRKELAKIVGVVKRAVALSLS
jgi:hypothetical protein